MFKRDFTIIINNYYQCNEHKNNTIWIELSIKNILKIILINNFDLYF